MPGERMGGYVPEEAKNEQKGFLTRLTERARSTVLGALVVAGLELGSPDIAEAQSADEVMEKFGLDAKKDREATNKAMLEYEALVREYYNLRPDLPTEQKMQEIDNMVDYFRDVIRGREASWIEQVAPMYVKKIKAEIDHLKKPKVKESKNKTKK